MNEPEAPPLRCRWHEKRKGKKKIREREERRKKAETNIIHHSTVQDREEREGERGRESPSFASKAWDAAKILQLSYSDLLCAHPLSSPPSGPSLVIATHLCIIINNTSPVLYRCRHVIEIRFTLSLSLTKPTEKAKAKQSPVTYCGDRKRERD